MTAFIHKSSFWVVFWHRQLRIEIDLQRAAFPHTDWWRTYLVLSSWCWCKPALFLAWHLTWSHSSSCSCFWKSNMRCLSRVSWHEDRFQGAAKFAAAHDRYCLSTQQGRLQFLLTKRRHLQLSVQRFPCLLILLTVSSALLTWAGYFSIGQSERYLFARITSQHLTIRYSVQIWRQISSHETQTLLSFPFLHSGSANFDWFSFRTLWRS